MQKYFQDKIALVVIAIFVVATVGFAFQRGYSYYSNTGSNSGLNFNNQQDDEFYFDDNYEEDAYDDGTYDNGELSEEDDWGDDEDIFEEEEGDENIDTSDIQTIVDRIKPAPGKAVIKGKVTDGDGNPVYLASIKINKTGAKTLTGISNKQGIYYILDIEPGDYKVSVNAPTAEANMVPPAALTLNLGADKKITQDFKFSGGGKTFSGSVKKINGQPLTDAKVVGIRSNPPAIVSKNVDSNGKFSMSVSGGSWFFSISPQDPKKSTWTRGGNIAQAKFAEDSVAESKSYDFIVDLPDATVKGTVKNSDGSAPSKGTMVILYDSTQYIKEVNSDGSFSIPVSASAYSVAVLPSDTKVSSPEPISISVATGETVDVGVINLIKDTGHIKGVIKNGKTGQPMQNVTVNISMIEGNNFQTLKTNSSGAYDISVSPGNWMVAVQPDAANLLADINNVVVNVAEKQTQDVNFTLTLQPAVLLGSLVNEKGKVATNVDGYVLASNTDGENFGGQITQGSYSFNLPAGTFNLHVSLAPDAAYSPGNDVSVSVAETDTKKSMNLNVATNKYEITGSVMDSTGKKVTGVKVRVFGSDSEGTWQQDEKTDGSYVLKVSPGTWSLGCDTDSDMYLPCDSAVAVTVSNKSVSKNLTLVKASYPLTGVAKDPAGKPLSNVLVSVDGGSADPANANTGRTFVASAETDKNGNFTTYLPKGTYYLHSYQNARRGLVSPDEQIVTVGGGQVAPATLTFKEAKAKISGKVLGADAKGKQGAIVNAWSENGGYVETKTNKDGAYSLSVVPDVWHVSSSLDANGKGYRTSAVEIDVGTQAENTLNLSLPAAAIALAPAVSRATNSGGGAAVELAGSVGAFLPVNSTETKKVTFSMTETSETRTQGTTNVLGNAFNIELRDTKGMLISDLMQPVVLTFPYKKNDLTAAGAKAKNLMPSYWDASVGSWRKLDNVIVNEKKGMITATSKHLTRFALVSPADETPPAAPGSLAISAKGAGALIAWQSPSVDYHHLKIYRSDKQGTLGNIYVDNVFGTSFEAKDDGAKYFYTLRSVDLAGNESQNVNQVSLAAMKVKRK
ncbi:MAG: carboxypeptidase-like regulatory domain-containing protein [Candidatus Gracilibacteria bacterium]